MEYKKDWGGGLKNKKIKKFIPMAAILLGLCLTGCAGNAPDQPEQAVSETQTTGLLAVLDSYRGYSRVVSAEEYEFYEYFVKRDLPGAVSAEELDALVKEYANEVNAVFYLGNRLGFCEPYSFETLQFRMEQENTKRQLQLEQGEVVYGLEQFTLRTYFQYTVDNLQASLEGYLEANADEEILERAKAYYEAHEEEFTYRKEIHYDQSLDGVTERLTADVDMQGFLGKADMGLADFLGIADVGDVYEDDKDGKARRVVIAKIIYSDKGYENNADMALYRLVTNELYDEVIKNTAKNNPLEFETN
jgi:hypothetical protein